MRSRITHQDVDDIAVGGAVLGAGSGGDPYLGKLMAQRAIEQYDAPELISLKDVPDTALVMLPAGIGAPRCGADSEFLFTVPTCRAAFNTSS